MQGVELHQGVPSDDPRQARKDGAQARAPVARQGAGAAGVGAFISESYRRAIATGIATGRSSTN